jgi:hypothetical protein
VSIQQATSNAAQKIGEEIGQGAVRATEQIARQLGNITEQAERTLIRYEGEVMATQWKVIGTTVVSCILASVLIVWLLIPHPCVPLTDGQIKDLRSGQLMALVWPKLSKKEQQHWLELANQIEHSSSNEMGSKQP